MKNKTLKIVTGKNTEKGLSAIELLIAMTIFLIVVASVYGILKIGNMSRATINARSENIKNVRMAINTIGREAVNAGLGYNRVGGVVPDDFSAENFGLPADDDEENDLLTAIVTGYNISESDLSKKGEKNDVVAFAFRDFEFNDGFPIIINDVKEDGKNLILKTPSGACANCRPYDLFLIETGDGKKAIILSTDIINNDSIVLGDDPLNANYGKKGKKGGDDDDDDDTFCLPLDLICIGKKKEKKSSVKKCQKGQTKDCIDYSKTSVVAKKIYLVSYSIGVDGTLIRTSFGNNTGGGADDQILRQPIASGVRNFKLKYLLTDGTFTEDPSAGNTQKERCNEIIQIEVSAVVDAETNSSEAVTLTSTFSTRNLKYDVY